MYQKKMPRRGVKRLGAAIAAVCAPPLPLGASNGAQANEGTGGAEPARRCWMGAVRGRIPAEPSYLEENYGVQVNHSRFIVSYEVYASNQAAGVAVLEKQTDGQP